MRLPLRTFTVCARYAACDARWLLPQRATCHFARCTAHTTPHIPFLPRTAALQHTVRSVRAPHATPLFTVRFGDRTIRHGVAPHTTGGTHLRLHGCTDVTAFAATRTASIIKKTAPLPHTPTAAPHFAARGATHACLDAWFTPHLLRLLHALVDHSTTARAWARTAACNYTPCRLTRLPGTGLVTHLHHTAAFYRIPLGATGRTVRHTAYLPSFTYLAAVAAFTTHRAIATRLSPLLTT